MSTITTKDGVEILLQRNWGKGPKAPASATPSSPGCGAAMRSACNPTLQPILLASLPIAVFNRRRSGAPCVGALPCFRSEQSDSA